MSCRGAGQTQSPMAASGGGQESDEKRCCGDECGGAGGVTGQYGLSLSRFALKASATLAHYGLCPRIRQWCSHATFFDRSRVSVREWFGLAPQADAVSSAPVNDARWGGADCQRVRASWTAGGRKRVSNSLDTSVRAAPG